MIKLNNWKQTKLKLMNDWIKHYLIKCEIKFFYVLAYVQNKIAFQNSETILPNISIIMWQKFYPILAYIIV